MFLGRPALQAGPVTALISLLGEATEAMRGDVILISLNSAGGETLGTRFRD